MNEAQRSTRKPPFFEVTVSVYCVCVLLCLMYLQLDRIKCLHQEGFTDSKLVFLDKICYCFRGEGYTEAVMDLLLCSSEQQ